MSSKPHYADLASRVLAQAAPEPGPPLAEDRAQAVSRIQQAIRAKARRGLIVRVLAVASTFAVAASVVIHFGWRGTPWSSATGVATAAPVAVTVEAVTGDVVTMRGTDEQPLSNKVPMTTGDRVVAKSHANARLDLSTGTKVVVEDGGDLTLVERGLTQIFALSAGSMRADVAKLHSDERFVVRTPEAEIEVRGTSFRLARIAGGPLCAQGLTTRLSVYEGVVAARMGNHEDRIGAGQEWTAPCERAPDSVSPTIETTPAITSPRDIPSANARPTMAPSTEGARGSSAPSPSGPTLQTINDLFAQAMDAKHRGDKDQALDALRRLETQYPSSPLAESASVERMKILASTNHAAASKAAESYLAKYPDGFARALAQGIMAKGP
jgi:hypothetical protein